MIAIINRGQKGKLHHYTVQINNEVITEFDHQRNEGLAVCLEKAAEAVRRQELINLTGLYDELRQNSL
jgi:hypothetical protein